MRALIFANLRFSGIYFCDFYTLYKTHAWIRINFNCPVRKALAYDSYFEPYIESSNEIDVCFIKKLLVFNFANRCDRSVLRVIIRWDLYPQTFMSIIYWIITYSNSTMRSNARILLVDTSVVLIISLIYTFWRQPIRFCRMSLALGTII